jgi:mRNA-degrading endonuclease YafQ of YafQ-DinJ toxin-antitoxin module
MSQYAEFLPRTKGFQKCLDRHKDKQKRIEAYITRILSDPYLNSHLLTNVGHTDLRGKRSRHLAPNFVFVYVVCEECVEASFRARGYNACPFCQGLPLKRVIFLGFGTHKDIYSKEWRA